MMHEGRRRLLIVEDEPLMAVLLKDVLVAHGFDVAHAVSVGEARTCIDEFDPDGLLLDISLGDGPSGVDLARVVSRQRPDIAIIFLTRYADPVIAGMGRDALPPGCGFLRKDMISDSDYLLSSINSVLTNNPRNARHDLLHQSPLSQLSTKQVEVLRLMAMGYTNERIAITKGVANSTVERWTVDIFRHLDIDTSAGLNPRVEAIRHFIAVAGLPERA